jgi:hypothetical protein
MIKLLVLTNQILISQIEEVGSELGEPDCKLIEPYVVESTGIVPWLMEHTIQSEFMISSDKVLTMAEPNNQLLEKYKEVLS